MTTVGGADPDVSPVIILGSQSIFGSYDTGAESELAKGIAELLTFLAFSSALRTSCIRGATTPGRNPFQQRAPRETLRVALSDKI
ncbi:hypothetical protein [Prescottella equi]|uniref:hypothetical protein n=1 Tax=Rhodococcus hoagii TaxID=43767 RepID=UPI001EE9CF2F|nr:hypothetical protein [Prescottella equi]